MTDGYTEREVINRLAERIAQIEDGQALFADSHGISRQLLCDILKGRRRLGQKILTALGLRKVVRYVPIDPEEGDPVDDG